MKHAVNKKVMNVNTEEDMFVVYDGTEFSDIYFSNDGDEMKDYIHSLFQDGVEISDILIYKLVPSNLEIKYNLTIE